MTDSEIALLSEWSVQTGQGQRSDVIHEYRYRTGQETIFIITVLEPAVDTEGYRLRFSTIDLSSNNLRHDYSVDEYDSREAAMESAESFAEHVSIRLDDDSISVTDPDIESIETTKQEFIDYSVFSPIQRLLARLR